MGQGKDAKAILRQEIEQGGLYKRVPGNVMWNAEIYPMPVNDATLYNNHYDKLDMFGWYMPCETMTKEERKAAKLRKAWQAERQIANVETLEEKAARAKTAIDEFDKAFPHNKTVNINLTTMEAKNGAAVNYIDGKMVITNTETNKGRVSTPQRFTNAVKIELRAKTDDVHIGMFYHGGLLTLNWEENRIELRLRDIANGTTDGYNGLGEIPANEFVDVEWICAKDFMAVRVNGELRHFKSDYFYNYKFQNDPDHTFSSQVSVTCIKGSMVTVESLKVTEV